MTTYQSSEEIESHVRTLIDSHYPDLADARIICLLADAHQRCRPRLLNPLERYLSQGDEIVIVVQQDDWRSWDAARRHAEIDHRLAHIESLDHEGEAQTYAIGAHGIEEFADVLQRNGAYRDELRPAVAIIRQLAFDDQETEIEPELVGVAR